MKNNKIVNNLVKIFLSIFLVNVIMANYTFAASRNLPGISLIERDERGAQEGWGYRESGRYDNVKKRNEEYQAWLDGKGIDSGNFAARKENEEKQDARRDFLEETYPSEVGISKTITAIDDKTLVRKQQIASDKQKIIIHHTADALKYPDENAARDAMQYFYTLHTLTRGRGDIGYNFVIDPFGNIYEGRSGGQGVVGGHADRNNISTLGIALMGNFDVVKPTSKAMRSLVKLATVLAYEYKITPAIQKPYFTVINKEPYLDVSFHDSVVGHQDTKNTACPGDNLYEKIPTIKEQIQARLSRLARNGVTQLNDDTFVESKTAGPFDGSFGVVAIPAFNRSDSLSCVSFDTPGFVSSCRYVDNHILVSLQYQGVGSSGIHTLGIKQGNTAKMVDISVLWNDELSYLLASKTKDFATQNPGLLAQSETTKISDRISLQQAKEYAKKDISVLLYELTSDYKRREFSCIGGCKVIIDGQTFIDPGYVHVVKQTETTQLSIFVDQKAYDSSLFGISTDTGLIEITNYERVSGENKLNRFRGSITISQGLYKHLEKGVTKDYLVINTLPFQQYMMGIGESSELQHPNKTRILAILAKQYALYYRSGINTHPSIPQGVIYTAVDDPRIFQRYIGAGQESYAKARNNAVEYTKNMFVTYENWIPILPYFHCSSGFTLSGNQKRGRTDTPWLRGVLDVSICENNTFQGHGVGLSGDGAEKLAQSGATIEQILKWYYSGIKLAK